jgi:hypothetical protein
MIFLFGIVIGLAAGLAFRYHRAIETKRALDASNYLRAVSDRTALILAGEVARRDQTLANIKALAMRVHTERILVLGGSVSLPDPARRTRQLKALNTDTEAIQPRLSKWRTP